MRVAVYGGLASAVGAGLFFPRGLDCRDGRHDRGENGMWLSHAWLGDDTWFTVNGKQATKARFREEATVISLRDKLDDFGIRDLFTHLCPAQPTARFSRSIARRRPSSSSSYREVGSRVDQLVCMLYDTSLRFRMPYRGIMRQWTEEILAWAPGTPTLLGLPAYDDPGVGYHDASVENLENALKGMHAGSTSFEALPDSYRGVAIYSEWEMNDAKWTTLREQFRRTRA